MLEFEFDNKGSRFYGSSFFLGIDEVGRGPLAGPVTAAAVLMQKDFSYEILEALEVGDSKKVKSSRRELICDELGVAFSQKSLKSYEEIAPGFYYSIVNLAPSVIDKINIYHASLRAMQILWKRAQKVWLRETSYTLLDGNKVFPAKFAEHERCEAVVKGDKKSLTIGLASIIAKVYRDQLMKDYAKTYPQYGFEKHAGYPTPQHKQAIQKYGVTSIHRKSFKTVKEALRL